MRLPDEGLGVDEVVDALEAKRSNDLRWREGRAFGLVFDGGPTVHEVAERVAVAFLHENGLNPAVVPSLAEVQSEVCAMTADLLGAPDAAGFLTSGGTESILVAVEAARERAKAERGVEAPTMVLADSAHAAFHKGAHLMGLEVRTVPVGDDLRADPEAMAAAVDDRTALVVASAPSYPHGVIDPVPKIAALAAGVGASCHVDACMGGFVLPFAERLGEDVPPWDLRVEGVTTISADLHKLGYAPKGASVILHRTKALRRYQTFAFDGWLGGFYGSPNLQGTRPGMPMATAWAVMRHLGAQGYVELTATTLRAARAIRAGVADIDGLTVVGDPRWHLHAVSGTGGTDVFAVGDAMAGRGWHHDRQSPPDALHATVSAGNAPHVEEYLDDLRQAVSEAASTPVTDRSTTYASS